MILDRLENAARYEAMYPGFRVAFEYLRKHHEGGGLVPGRHEVDGVRVYASVGKDEGRGRDGARLEAHRKYIDIQYVVSGHEVIGWRHLGECMETGQGYDADRDIEFFSAQADVWVPVHPGLFAIFFPEDAHAPLAGHGHLHKIVMKVAV